MITTLTIALLCVAVLLNWITISRQNRHIKKLRGLIEILELRSKLDQMMSDLSKMFNQREEVNKKDYAPRKKMR